MHEKLRKRWILRQPDQAFVNRCCDELKLSALLARVIALRDLTAIEAAKCYLSSSLRSDLPSPFLMADMDAAADRIVRAIQASESISIWGDYDVDGTTGASVLVSFLREIGVETIFYVPHRIEEGYGLNIEGLRRLKERGVRLVVTVDSGISNFKEVAAAREIGVDIVIVDHHQPPEQLPPAIAVVNPHRSDCAFPDKGLCAAGLAFYVVIALRARLRDVGWFRASGDPDLRRHLDIVALGTIADMVPLKGVNRTLVKRGLTALGSSTRPGVIALKQIAGFAPGDVTAGQVGFQLGPRINAAGRMDAAIKVIELLTTESPEVALRIAQELDAHNRERRTMEAEVLQTALEQAGKVIERRRYSLVLSGEGWHPGVLGIVASRVVERFHRPTVVLGFQGGEGKGSARSIRGFHMVEGLRRCGYLLEKFGGHEYAGGLTIKEENLPSFIEAFDEAARAVLSDEALVPFLEIDAQLNFAEIGHPLLREIDVLKPFGVGNPEPIFLSQGIEVCERKDFALGARFRFRQAGRFVSGVAFGVKENFAARPGALVDLVYRLSENVWNGNSTVELKLLDSRMASVTSAQV
jgi:single-stranded-DNA-specific exonuclease